MSIIIENTDSQYKAESDPVVIQKGDKVTIRLPALGSWFDTVEKRNKRLMIVLKKDV